MISPTNYLILAQTLENKLVAIMYTDIQSTILNNGYMNPPHYSKLAPMHEKVLL